MVGLRSKLAAFKLQRFVTEYPQEPLSAILPGAALQELWGLVGTAETALSVISAMVVVTALLGMATMILATLGERRRELAILRSLGARPATIVGLLVAEAGVLALAGAGLGVALLYGVLLVVRPLLDARFGLALEVAWPSARELGALVAVLAAGLLAGLLPALRAYRLSLSDGMMVRT
jgi:putative ABC transport system permease protein